MTTTSRFGAAVCALALLATGCSPLDVSDPTKIEESEVANGTSAVMMRATALHQLYRAFSFPALYGAIWTDEFLADPALSTTTGVSILEVADRRSSEGREETFATPYSELAAVRLRAGDALRQLRAFAPAAVKDAYMGEMFAARGLVEVLMAETFCSGFPLNEAVDNQVRPGAPLSTPEVFEHALAEFDSALVHAADSARILNFARVGQARALLGLGRLDEAAAAAAPVPTDYSLATEYTSTYSTGAVNTVFYSCCGTPTWSPADQEGGIGLDFVSASDPRLGLVFVAKGRGGVADMYRMAKYPSRTAPIVMASGIEARLIQAEAALKVGAPSWLTILNDLRATQVSPAMAALSDPGTESARVDLLFRERAFWLYATGHRLGDLRRLIAHYGRAPETVFPTGPYHRGGVYEAGTSLPFPVAAEANHNSAITGCTSR